MRIERLFPAGTTYLRQAIAPVARIVRALDSEHVDLFAPDQLVERCFESMQKLLDQIPLVLIRDVLTRLVSDDGFWRPAGAGARRGSDVLAICDYFKAVNARWPFASTILILGSRYFHRGLFTDLLRAAGQLRRAKTSRNEHRAEWLRIASSTIVESLYYEFVSFVYAAECLMRGDKISLERGGRQLRYVVQHTSTSLSGMFAGDEGHLRNAAVHYDRWRYSIATKTVHVSDLNWSAQFSTTELLAEVRSLLDQSVLPMHVVGRLHAHDARLLLRVFLADTLSPELAAKVEDWKKTEAALKALGWKPTTDTWIRN